MRGKVFWAAGPLLVVGITLTAFGFARSQASTPDQVRSDCPGKFVCPLSGEEVCKDQCPLRDVSRSDCPGQIECPVTGELVCRDECPLATDSAAETVAEAELPPCCRGAKTSQ